MAQAGARAGHARVIAIASQKGGVGKTTTAVNLGVQLARRASARWWSTSTRRPRPRRCWAPRWTNSTSWARRAPRSTTWSAIRGATCRLPILEVGEGLHLAPSHIDLAAAEQELNGRLGHEKVLAEKLAPLLGVIRFHPD